MNLAGQYRLHPGSHPGISGSRPVIGGARLGRMLRGQQGDSVVTLLGSVLTLCAHAQRRTARMALWTAEHQEHAPVGPDSTALLQLETAGDHLRSMALDWPRRPQESPGDISLQWLAECPLPLAPLARSPAPEVAAQLRAQLQTWLESRILQMPVHRWLLTYRDPDAFAAWCTEPAQRATTPLQCLAAWQSTARHLRPETRTLDLLDTDAAQQGKRLSAIAAALAESPDFAQFPLWLGACAETGVWSRLRHRSDTATPLSALSRLQRRWLEMLELASTPADQHPALLQCGAMPLGGGQAIAWCEMARGLLLHWVQLDEHQRVHDYRVLAPTEWNFHPDGALAHAVTQLHPADTAAAECLTLAYDPCVECSISIQEMHHA